MIKYWLYRLFPYWKVPQPLLWDKYYDVSKECERFAHLWDDLILPFNLDSQIYIEFRVSLMLCLISKDLKTFPFESLKKGTQIWGSWWLPKLVASHTCAPTAYQRYLSFTAGLNLSLRLDPSYSSCWRLQLWSFLRSSRHALIFGLIIPLSLYFSFSNWVTEIKKKASDVSLWGLFWSGL